MTTAAAARVPILMYHEIAEPTETHSRLAVTPANFAAQLDYLHSAGFTAMTAAELSARLATGIGPLPDRPIALTFDDGYADFHSRAMPLLDRHGFTATLFVTTGWAQDADLRPSAPGRMLNRTQLAEAAAAGMEIAAHTRSHPQLDQLPERAVREELGTSKRWLEDEIGLAVPGLAYPFGYSSARVRQLAREAGYRYAHAVDNATASRRADPFAVPRLTVRRATTLAEFRRLVDGQPTLRLLEDRALTRGWSVVRQIRAARGSTTAPSTTAQSAEPT
jgi:peptidoglycan/xylan/chitin deacetylase (PgdA/CDA1 family)